MFLEALSKDEWLVSYRVIARDRAEPVGILLKLSERSWRYKLNTGKTSVDFKSFAEALNWLQTGG